MPNFNTSSTHTINYTGKYKAVFFDLDGTLLDTSRDLTAALNTVLVEDGLEIIPEVVARKEVSNGANALIQLGFGDKLDAQTHQNIRQRLLAAYEKNIATYTKTFDGIDGLLENLAAANIPWGIVTNKPERYTNALLAQLRFPSQPVAVICPDHVVERKPHPEGLLMACNAAQCSPAEAIYIGDHKRDIEAGQNAGMATIAVGYGFTESKSCHKLWRADFNVDLASEIWPLLLNRP